MKTQLRDYRFSFTMTQPQHPTNEQLAPTANRYHMAHKNNVYFDPERFTCSHAHFIPVLQGHPIWYAMNTVQAVSETYMQQFWLNMAKVNDNTCKTRINTTEVVITKNILRKVLNLGEPEDQYDDDVSGEQICSDIQTLGYEGELTKTNLFSKPKLCEPWQTLFLLVNKCLSPKHTGHDRANQNIMSIFHGIAMNRRIDFGKFIWKDFTECAKTKDSAKSGRSLPYHRFTAFLISYFQVLHPEIIPRTDIFQPHRIKSFNSPARGARVVNAVPRVIPLDMLAYADPNNSLIKRYKKQYYDGDNLRTQPLGDAKLSDDDDSDRTHSDNNHSDEDQPSPPPPSQAILHALRKKATHDFVARSSQSPSETQRQVPRQSGPHIILQDVSVSEPSVSVATSAATHAVDIPVTSSVTTEAETPISMEFSLPMTTEAETPVSMPLILVLVSAAGPTDEIQTGGSQDFDYDTIPQDLDEHVQVSMPVVLSETTTSVVVDNMIQVLLSSISQSSIEPITTRILTPPHTQSLDDISSDFEQDVPVSSSPQQILQVSQASTSQVSSPVSDPLSISTTLPMTSLPAMSAVSSPSTVTVISMAELPVSSSITTSVAAPPIFTASTTMPSTQRESALIPPSSTSDPFTIFHAKQFEARLNNHLSHQTATIVRNIYGALRDFLPLRPDVATSVPVLPRHPAADAPVPQAVAAMTEAQLIDQFSTLPTEAMESLLLSRLLAENPNSNATDLSSFYVEQHCCKQAELRKTKRHEDPDDPSGPHERERGGMTKRVTRSRASSSAATKEQVQKDLPQSTSAPSQQQQ